MSGPDTREAPVGGGASAVGGMVALVEHQFTQAFELAERLVLQPSRDGWNAGEPARWLTADQARGAPASERPRIRAAVLRWARQEQRAAGRTAEDMLAAHDRDGVAHRWAMPMELLAGDGADLRRELLRLGFEPGTGPKGRAWLQEHLVSWRPADKVRCVERVGWHGDVFVLPDRTVGQANGPVVLQAPAPPKVAREGTPESWRSQVALLATGKTTLRAAAASVAGGEVGSWRATDNGLEAVAAGASDLALLLDELGQAPAAVPETASYMLGNGRGKALMTETIVAREALAWRTVLYASGEVGLAAKLGEAGKRPAPCRRRGSPAGSGWSPRRASSPPASEVTGWPPGAALGAAERRFREWLEDRGSARRGRGPRVRGAGAALFLEQHGLARFEPAWANEQEAAAAALARSVAAARPGTTAAAAARPSRRSRSVRAAVGAREAQWSRSRSDRPAHSDAARPRRPLVPRPAQPTAPRRGRRFTPDWWRPRCGTSTPNKRSRPMPS